jgi:hypothetical protein
MTEPCYTTTCPFKKVSQEGESVEVTSFSGDSAPAKGRSAQIKKNERLLENTVGTGTRSDYDTHCVPFGAVCSCLLLFVACCCFVGWLLLVGCSCCRLQLRTTTISNTTGVASATAEKCAMHKVWSPVPPPAGNFTHKLRVIYHSVIYLGNSLIIGFSVVFSGISGISGMSEVRVKTLLSRI